MNTRIRTEFHHRIHAFVVKSMKEVQPFTRSTLSQICPTGYHSNTQNCSSTERPYKYTNFCLESERAGMWVLCNRTVTSYTNIFEFHSDIKFCFTF
jgi:hypothetical protein